MPTRDTSVTATSETGFARRMLIAIAMIAAALMLWELRSALLLLFAAALVAVMLTAIARWLRRRLPIGQRLALALTLFLLLALVGVTFYLFGAEVYAQFVELSRRLPGAWRDFERLVGEAGLTEELSRQMRSAAPDAGRVFSFITGFVSALAGVATGVGLAIVGGIFLAAQPAMYRDGVLMLWPRRSRARTREALDATGDALKSWLIGQGAAMLAIGVLTTLGLWAIGVPSPIALGLIAGMLTFVPFAGPLLSAIPALLVALSSGGDLIWWTLGLYVLIQQLEGNIITPMLQAEASALPPALTIFTLVGFGILFGPAGILLAVPLTVVAYALVGKLWVRDTLHEQVTLPGEEV